MDMDGKLRNISEWDNKIVVIVFWAVWDPYSHRIFSSALVELQDKYRDQGLQFVAISIHDDEGQVSDFLKDYTVNFPILIGVDKASKQMKDYGINATPTQVFIDRDGYIRHEQRGFWDLVQIESLIRDLL